MKKEKKLTRQVLTMIIIVFFFLLTATGFALSYNSKQSVKASIGQRTVEIAENMLNFIDVEQYKKLTANPEENDLYWDLRNQLNELREMNGVMYAYTYMVPKEGDKVTILVDGMPKNAENASSLGDISPSTTYEDLQKVLKEGSYYTDLLSSDYGEYVSGAISMKDKNGEVIAFLGIDIDATYIDESSSEISNAIVPKVSIFLLVIMLIGVFIIQRYVNSSLKPLNVLNEASSLLVEGDLKGVNDKLNSMELKHNNEVSVFSNTFSQVILNLSQSLANLNAKSKDLVKVVENIDYTAKQVSNSNSIIASNITEIASSSDRQEASNNEVTQSMNEMTIGIQRLADTTTDVAGSSNQMTKLVETSVEHATKVVTQIQNVENSVLHTENYVREMSEKFKSIKDMVSVITNIAEQTNLLALNAAIEAARAGEAGKGFAVVADEVRKLAEMSRNSASDIQEYLQNFLVISEKALGEMENSAEEVKVGNQSVNEIGEKLQDILKEVVHVNGNIQDNSAVLEQMSASSQEILASSEEMQKLVISTVNQTKEVASSSNVQIDMVRNLEEVVQTLNQTAKEINVEINKYKI